MNRFELHCRTPDPNGWGVNYRCCPCCHEATVRAYPLLIRGYVPGTPEWTAALSLSGDSPDRFKLSELDQDALSRILAGADIASIIAHDTRKLWQDHLALGLKYTADCELRTLRLSRAWVPQLRKIFSPPSPPPYFQSSSQLQPSDILALSFPGRPDHDWL